MTIRVIMFVVQATGISWSVLFTFEEREWSRFKSQKLKVTPPRLMLAVPFLYYSTFKDVIKY
jgi:hypothetical protein